MVLSSSRGGRPLGLAETMRGGDGTGDDEQEELWRSSTGTFQDVPNMPRAETLLSGAPPPPQSMLAAPLGMLAAAAEPFGLSSQAATGTHGAPVDMRVTGFDYGFTSQSPNDGFSPESDQTSSTRYVH